MLDQGLTCSLQYFSIRMFLKPFFPARDLVGNFWEYSFEVFPLDCEEPIFVGIPQSSSLPVVQNEGGIIGPTRWNDGQCLAIDLTAVHSRQVNQWSVTYSYRFFPYAAV